MQIRQSAEDYLEAILILSKQGPGVRSVDIASMLEGFQAKCKPRNEAAAGRRIYSHGPVRDSNSPG